MDSDITIFYRSIIYKWAIIFQFANCSFTRGYLVDKPNGKGLKQHIMGSPAGLGQTFAIDYDGDFNW